jgi:hypothetical protein
MDADDVTSSKRSGAVTGSSTTAAAPGLERLLRRKGKALTPALFLRVAEWVLAEREKAVPKTTQGAFAAKHGINVRQVQTYEAAARWPAEAKAFIRAHADRFCISDLTRDFANRSWSRKDAFLSALRSHVEGTRRRKRRSSSRKLPAAVDPDVLALQDRLREKLQTRVEIVGSGVAGELRIAYFSLDDFERIVEQIERG